MFQQQQFNSHPSNNYPSSNYNQNYNNANLSPTTPNQIHTYPSPQLEPFEDDIVVLPTPTVPAVPAVPIAHVTAVPVPMK